MNPSELPQTDSIQELAWFWDEHDLTDFDGELEEVEATVFDREAVISVHLSPREAEAVRELARSKGIADADLIHEWVAEKVHGL